MHTHEEIGLATWDLEKDCYNKEALVSDWIQTFYSEAIIKLKGASVRFKDIPPSKAGFKNEINNETLQPYCVLQLCLLTGYKMYPGIEFS